MQNSLIITIQTFLVSFVVFGYSGKMKNQKKKKMSLFWDYSRTFTSNQAIQKSNFN